MPSAAAPRVLFLGTTYAGWRTRFENLKAHTQHDRRIRPVYHTITGWNATGTIERLPGVPRSVKGRVRGVLEAAAYASTPRPDVIWFGGVPTVLLPYVWAQFGALRRPMIHELDWTVQQQEAFAPMYYNRPPRKGARLALARWQERLIWSNVSLFTPMSNWAAHSLRQQGVRAERIHVLHPGLDLSKWQPHARTRDSRDSKLRLLFVGGDFERKGGSMLLDVFRARFADRCDLDIVTTSAVDASPGVRVHTAQPNSDKLHGLYAAADLLVLPTRADCFGHVAVEALASGLPVVMSDVGGVRDIIDDDKTGWLIQPDRRSLADALERALHERHRLPDMGRLGREVAEQRFDGPRNDSHLVDLLVQQANLNHTSEATCQL